MSSPCSVLSVVLNPFHAVSHFLLMSWPHSRPFCRCGSRGLVAKEHAQHHTREKLPFPSGAPCPELCSQWVRTTVWSPCKETGSHCPRRQESQTGLASESLCSLRVSKHFPSKQKTRSHSFFITKAIYALLRQAEDT